MSTTGAADKDGQKHSDILPRNKKKEICEMESDSSNQNDASDIKILSANDSGSCKAKNPSNSPILVEVVHVNPPKLSDTHLIHELKKSSLKKNQGNANYGLLQQKTWSKNGTWPKFTRGSPHSHVAGLKKQNL